MSTSHSRFGASAMKLRFTRSSKAGVPRLRFLPLRPRFLPNTLHQPLLEQIRLSQIRRRAAQHLVLLLQQPDPLLRLTQLSKLGRARTALEPVLPIGRAQPVRQTRLADAEIGRDLLHRLPRTAIARDPDNV